MKHRYLGNSGLAVSRVCLGTMTFGNKSWGCDEATSQALLDAYIDSGGNFIDTADLYSDTESEKILGNILKGKNRDDLVIASKCWFPMNESPNARGLSRKHIIEACEASLTRMNLDYMDLYQIHGPDPYTPIEETMSALDDLVRSGKIRYIGCSNLYAWQIVKANATADKQGGAPFISGQYLYNLIRRDIETEIIPACVDQGMGVLCWSPLASGLLTGKYQGVDIPEPGLRFKEMGHILNDRFIWKEALELVDMVCQIGDELGKNPVTVALSWILKDQAITSVLAGSRSVEQLQPSLEAGEWDLPDEHAQKLTEKLPHEHGYPCDWMKVCLLSNFTKTERVPNRVQRFPPLA
ncbi:MAG TPA: aldo/keto reductase [Opitutae bacterium]|nr:aldo/keto reductase [Opitutaceae bacterium]HCR30767.1 aldo/keto reductase [Opitutae bacterium]